jgi:hypothetical protein
MRVPRSCAKPRRAFYVNEYNVNHCEGIAGLVFHNGQLSSELLPDLHNLSNEEEGLAKYASLTHDRVEVVRKKRYFSRKIAGVTAYVDGLRWGVLIFDSVDPTALSNDHLSNNSVKRPLGVLTAILEKAQ